MLTLNMTSGANDETIWVMRTRGEGRNLLTNGSFASSSGWTLNGGWVISGGVATYTEPGIPPLDNSLYRTITAVENTSYVLEYEVISCSDPLTEMNVEGGGDNIISVAVRLDNSVGKHTINLLGVALKTKFTISFSSISAGESIVIDNLNLRKLDNIAYISTRDISLSNNYSGNILSGDNYISEIPFDSTIKYGGGAGSITSFSFSVSRYVNDTNFDRFFNEFYPATDGGFIVGRIIDFGIVWSGATTDSEITWLFRGRIIDYNYRQRQLIFSVFQESELTNKEVPYYKIQKDFDNDISYYLNAPEENYSLTLPIVYGSFNVDLFEQNLKKISPSPCVDKRYLVFAQATHKLYTQNSPTYTDALYKYISGADTYMVLIPDNGDSENNNHLSKVKLYDVTRTAGQGIKGKLFLIPKSIGIISDYNDIENILDSSTSTYITVTDTNELAIKVAECSTSAVGILGQAASDFQVVVSWQSNNGGDRQITVRGYNEALSSPAYVGSQTDNTTVTGGTWDYTYLNLGNITTNKSNPNLPYTIEEVSSFSYSFLNSSGSGAVSGDINIRLIYIELSNIIVVGTFKNTNVRPLSTGVV